MGIERVKAVAERTVAVVREYPTSSVVLFLAGMALGAWAF